MVRRILITLFILVLLCASWVWFNREDLMTARAAPWNPPVEAASREAPAPRAPCAVNDPLRRAWFGDLHVHTRYSFDARSRDMLGSPDDAYRYARGEEIGLGPFDAAGVGQRRVRIDQPLDFAAVTDHAEWVGEVTACTEPGLPSYDSYACQAFRGEVETRASITTLIGGRSRMLNLVGVNGRAKEVCGADASWCRDALSSAWELTREVTEKHYDRSADCSFTSFHGYEYSSSPARAKVHRNVIFRNERVPELPVSALEERSPFGLWERLDELCTEADGHCEAISIPHNPNVSNGRMFTIPWRNEAQEEQRRLAALRARYEPVVEMMQVKGESECKPGMWQVFGEDEMCDFEKLRGLGDFTPEDCVEGTDSGAVMGWGCQSRLDFARYALIEGMAEEERIGINPYRFGFAGSTDSHNASPGDVDEETYDGCCAIDDATAEARMAAGNNTISRFAGRDPVARNPGGLMGVWAEENSRDSLFDAMQRREVFATSGTRIQPRFFAGSTLPESICDGDTVERGYADGVPMGGVLGERFGQSPVFAAAAKADPRGGLLQRLQVIKVWYDSEGRFHQAVYDIAGDKDNGAGVDLDSCAVSGPGETQLCATWRDPQFDASRSAAYYLRVLENPSCRWSWRQCLDFPEGERPAGCSDPQIDKVIQERAWSSPIWYAPAK